MLYMKCFILVINGNWGSWGGLSTCSVSCGTGTQSRMRYCNNPVQSNGGLSCMLSNGMRATRETLTSSCQMRQCVQGNVDNFEFPQNITLVQGNVEFIPFTTAIDKSTFHLIY